MVQKLIYDQQNGRQLLTPVLNGRILIKWELILPAMVAAAGREFTGHGSTVKWEVKEPAQILRCFHKVHDEFSAKRLKMYATHFWQLYCICL